MLVFHLRYLMLLKKQIKGSKQTQSNEGNMVLKEDMSSIT